jgi:hypothetical protein
MPQQWLVVPNGLLKALADRNALLSDGAEALEQVANAIKELEQTRKVVQDNLRESRLQRRIRQSRLHLVRRSAPE